MPPVSLPDEVRAACAWVAEHAGSVRIEPEAVEGHAAALSAPEGEVDVDHDAINSPRLPRLRSAGGDSHAVHCLNYH
jgi:hypothetical protein